MNASTETRPAPSVAREAADEGRPDPPGTDPAIDARDPEQVVREAREAAGAPSAGAPAIDAVREAVSASEAAVGTARTLDRIESGSLRDTDGGAVLDGLSADQRTDLAVEYVGDLRARASDPHGIVAVEADQLAKVTKSLEAHVDTFYANGPEAFATLKDLDEGGRADFVAGRTDIGEPRAGAPAGGPNREALAALAEIREGHPVAADMVDSGHTPSPAYGGAKEVGAPDPGRDGPTDAERQEVNPAKQSLGDELSPMNRMEHQLAYQAASPQQI